MGYNKKMTEIYIPNEPIPVTEETVYTLQPQNVNIVCGSLEITGRPVGNGLARLCIDKILIDGVEQKGVQEITFHASVDTYPSVTIRKRLDR